MKRLKNRRRIAVFTILCVLAFSLPLKAETKETKEPSQLYATSACLMDGESTRILFGKKEEEKKAMASTTKIMTCILALELGNPEDEVLVSSKAASMPKVKLNIKKGETYRLGDLLYSLMLESHNDTAVAIAEHIGGSVEGFAELMNQKAKDIGASDTNFVTPNGLDDVNHYTTAKDLALIMRYCAFHSPKKEEFLKITQTKQHRFTTIKGNRSCFVSNKNAFLDMFPGVITGKTGFTGDAGYCYVCVYEKDGRRLIAVVLASGWPPDKRRKWKDTRKLLTYGIKAYEERKLFQGTLNYSLIPVKNGVSKNVSTYIDGELTMLLRKDEESHVEYECPSSLLAPVQAEEIIGHANVYIGKEIVGVFPIKTSTGSKKTDYWYYLKNVLKSLWI